MTDSIAPTIHAMPLRPGGPSTAASFSLDPSEVKGRMACSPGDPSHTRLRTAFDLANYTDVRRRYYPTSPSVSQTSSHGLDPLSSNR